MPSEEEEADLITKAHERIGHRSVDAVYYFLRKEWYWPGMKETIREVLKKCEVCQINNRKDTGGSEFVTTSRRLEKVGLDMLEIREQGRYVLVAIDYFTRMVWARVLRSKETMGVVETIRGWMVDGYKPEEIITDNAKEFCSSEFEKMCADNGIKHTRTAIESHRSNGRAERAIETIRDGMAKDKVGTIEQRIKRIVQRYNEVYHSGIRETPTEAWEDKKGIAQIENSPEGKYQMRFKKGSREIFEEGQDVRIAKRENLGNDTKDIKGRFVRQGTIVGICGGDSYMVKDGNEKITKKRHYDLKGM